MFNALTRVGGSGVERSLITKDNAGRWSDDGVQVRAQNLASGSMPAHRGFTMRQAVAAITIDAERLALSHVPTGWPRLVEVTNLTGSVAALADGAYNIGVQEDGAGAVEMVFSPVGTAFSWTLPYRVDTRHIVTVVGGAVAVPLEADGPTVSFRGPRAAVTAGAATTLTAVGLAALNVSSYARRVQGRFTLRGQVPNAGLSTTLDITGNASERAVRKYGYQQIGNAWILTGSFELSVETGQFFYRLMNPGSVDIEITGYQLEV